MGRWTAIGFAALGLSACANVGLDPAPAPADVAATSWEVTTRPDLDLWYHGLAYTDFGAEGETPIYEPGYVETVVDVKRATSVYPTALDEQAAEFGRRFAADERFGILQFLPLYFETDEAFYSALETWIQVDGNAQSLGNTTQAQAVAFISQQLPTAAERQTVAEWLEVLALEDQAFFDSYRQELMADEFAGVTRSVQSVWDRIAPDLEPVLDYVMMSGGDLILSVPVGSEGRTVNLARQTNRVATGMPDANAPDRAVWAFVHELMYPLVAPIIEDQIAPADLREMDREALARRTAIRAGSILLEQVAPSEVGNYRAAYLHWEGAAIPADAGARRAAFIAAFPIPDALPPAIEERITLILTGF